MECQHQTIPREWVENVKDLRLSKGFYVQ
jgi:hypothetical protein